MSTCDVGVNGCCKHCGARIQSSNGCPCRTHMLTIIPSTQLVYNGIELVQIDRTAYHYQVAN